ncbi:DUF6443 domain-containing protein [Flagellimonas sp. HMM57]|uniref:DUF6443 domain-containing protein n=1 Tax=unclassified Flagellimonas TaxID=2644544 RepID=UPI0013D75AB2|nr:MULTISPECIES: DUF6443 domain-containing protein [unclassified Flagellimonas]UII76207.1 DUF6443 domain-containing protein [Flagellimonas sp. HMM57]
MATKNYSTYFLTGLFLLVFCFSSMGQFCPNVPQNFGFNGGTKTVVISNNSCKALSAFSNVPGWLTVTRPSGNIKIVCQANTGGSRNATITYQTNSGTQFLWVNQNAYPALPPMPSISQNCGSTVLTKGSAPSNISWYWQSSSGDTKRFAANSASSITFYSSGTHYLRARNSGGEWGPARTINYSVNLPPPTPSMPSVSNNCGNTVLTRGNPPGGITWYWQTTASDTIRSSASMNKSVTFYTNGTYYLRSRNNSSGCWGGARTINYTVDKVPGQALGTGGERCDTGTVSLTASLGSNANQVRWYATPTGGTPLHTGTNFTTPSISQTTLYYVESYNTATQCSSSSRNSVEAKVLQCSANAETYNYIYTRSYQKKSLTTLDQAWFTTNDSLIQQLTFFDGLGRPMQLTAMDRSTSGKDIVTHIAYDALGRSEKEYLPHPSVWGGTGDFRLKAKDDTSVFYDSDAYEYTDNPYSEKSFEPSPLSRVLKQAAPGNDWRMGGGHEIEFDYSVNTVTDAVARFVVTFVNGDPSSPELSKLSGHYAQGELHKTVTKDENHDGTASKLHTTEEFTDKLGRTVLKRTYAEVGSPSAVEAHDTYYVYDDYGNPTYVIPPKVDTSNGVSGTELNELCYQYKYDHRNRLVEKKVPGKDPEEIVYNTLDQPVLTRDANLQADGKWLFTKYDALGRVVLTGILNSNMTRSQAQANVENATAQYEEKVGQGYTDNAYPKISTGSPAPQVHTINFYDNYNFPLLGYTIPTDVLGQTVSQNVKGLPTGGSILVLDGNNDKWIGWARAYDEKGRMIAEGTLNDYLDTFDQMETKLDFVGRPLQTVTTHTKGANAPIVTVDDFEYDHMGRLTRQTQTIGSHTETLTENTYDELGQLVQKKVGGNLQTVDYKYNVRGWLKQINDPTTMGNDLFAFGINYNTVDHGGTPLYNGNISETEWRTANVDNGLKWYRYGYDALNRITNATNSSANYNLDLVEYDKNGNITKLERKGHTNAGATTFGNMDRLIYYYHTDSNQIRKVTDFWNDDQGFKDGTNTNNDFEYDANGNLTSDANKGITNIAYNHLNLPTQVTVSNSEHNGTIDYVYDARGRKVQKILTNNGSITATTQYADKFIYENGNLQFFSHPEGYVMPNGNNYDYVYQYKDHLNNVRLSYSDSDGNGSIDPSNEIIEESNFYPFGGKHKGYNNVTSPNGNSTAQMWKFGNKEYDESLGLETYDFGARNYDPWLGRWANIDPKAHKYFSYSPYNYAVNNPLIFVDPDGKELILAGNRKERRQLFREVKKLSNDRLKLNRKTGQVTVRKSGGRNKGKDLKEGTALVSNIIGSKNTVTAMTSGRFKESFGKTETMLGTNIDQRVMNVKGNNTMDGNNDPKFNIGSKDALVIFDSSDSGADVKNEDGTFGNRPNFIGLGHELIHASRIIGGQVVEGDELSRYFIDPDAPDLGPGGNPFTFSDEEIEVRDIENLIRSEHKIIRRADPVFMHPDDWKKK